ncbi:hypothetical protein KFE25_008451 [Diacronema lutheri]|uniref:Uncharacterized protein n=1 Tax=Diacronema lutheri TaxID=2081491 RepID=A0A8J5X631_DIALT|nr:hypothetical protein KFE25_008451 [Diacronema lutheri]
MDVNAHASRVHAVRLALSSGFVGACVGFAAGFKVAESIYADDLERRRFANTVKLSAATAGVTLAAVGMIRVAFALS